MSKKNILVIFTAPMELGGIERSLIGLLDSFDYSKYNVDLFLYSHHGPLFSLINKRVNILPEINELAYLRESLYKKIKNRCYYSALLRIRDGVIGKFTHDNFDKTWTKIIQKKVPELDKQYDLALSFFLPFDLLKEKVKSKVKVGWVHTDYKFENSDRNFLKESYDGIDYIAAVSDSCAESFCDIFPEYRSKVIKIENILSKKFIEEQSKIDADKILFDKNYINILSIGRFSYPKNFDNVPEICSLILKNGVNVKWYLIGYGNDEELIRSKIKEFKMEDNVVILGKKENPYPYIKACDVYIQPSRYEGKSVAVREAQLLGKPVIITNYETANSQLRDGYDGIIVPIGDNEKSAYYICEVLRNSSLRNLLSMNCLKENYTDNHSLDALYNLMK